MSIENAIANIPNYSDEKLVLLLRRALFINGRAVEAKKLREAIEREIKTRRKNANSISGTAWPAQGMLAVMGYHVGFDSGLPLRERHLLLDYILVGELPFVHSLHYMLQWGRPGSEKRRRKLENCLQAFIDNKVKPNNYMKAIGEWSADLAYLKVSQHLAINKPRFSQGLI